MNFFTMLFNDPIVYISIIGLGVVFGICGFYVYFFIKNIEQNN